ncbi:MAG: DUF4339 domain-containing protein [Tissierellales bacterium]|nr:DUF4339 domain-containing protein [Candidatus Dojkabacteria bacterium]MBN2827736.1 DUF4339 domain-containing protein [Tissierellales bacterium]
METEKVLQDENSIDNDTDNEKINYDKEDFKVESETVEKGVSEVSVEVKNDSEEKSIGCNSPSNDIKTKKYYYSKWRRKKGPYTEDEINRLRLRPDTLIWTEGLENWRPLSEFKGVLITTPPLPKELMLNKNKTLKKALIFLVLLIISLGTSFVGTYYIMEAQKNKYFKSFKYEIDKLFTDKIVICGGKKYRTEGELREINRPDQPYDESDDSDRVEIFYEIIEGKKRALPMYRFDNQGEIFKYDKLMKHGSEYWLESYASKDLEYFARVTENGRIVQFVSPEEAYNNCFLHLCNKNAECFKEDFYERLSYFVVLNNKYFHIAEYEGARFDRSFGTEYYHVNFEEGYTYYHIAKNDSAIEQDFRMILIITGGISIFLIVLLYIFNPFKW